MSTPVKAKALNCPNCGGTVQLRGLGQALSAVCIQCLSIIDTSSAELRIIQQFKVKERVAPLIPLGTRGKLHGADYEAIGFQTRQIMVEGTAYEWREYVLFNPYKGFRYLSEYDGHWNDIKPLTGLPERVSHQGKPAATWLGKTYRHFQNADAETTYVMGEFPWKVMVGERAITDDYVAPPDMLSSEKTGSEVNWSHGVYMAGEQVRAAFSLPNPLPPSRGVFANQPSPHAGKPGSAWRTAVLLWAALAMVMFGSSLLMGQKEVFKQMFTFTQGSRGEPSLVTGAFDLDGRETNVELSVRTDLDNRWAYFNFALINEKTGQAYDFGREVSYYRGRDSDGDWTEGSSGDTVLIPSVPAGRYYLRVEPEMDPSRPGQSMRYSLTLRRDVPWNLPFFVAFILIAIPAILITLRSAGFESRRWAESDYAPSSSGDDEDDDE
ncbi:MAG: DUF4178 domain-containing protein [Acidimicrobiia bacterium]|nr:DUF4178 domain-containing protein [Acidimicrobiia bacterium]